jgi:ribonuclease-3
LVGGDRIHHIQDTMAMDEDLSELQRRLGYTFADVELLRRALTHASAAVEGLRSNERLEFLGDAVLGLIVSDHLFETMPDGSEGDMTAIKSSLVSRRALLQAGRALGLAAALRVDEGLAQHEQYPGRIIANAYEAVLGALYLDAGLDVAQEFVLRTLSPVMERVMHKSHVGSFKAVLQQISQSDGGPAPSYEIVDQSGPHHRMEFEAVVSIEGKLVGTGRGHTKKSAEEAAAREALEEHFPDYQL